MPMTRANLYEKKGDQIWKINKNKIEAKNNKMKLKLNKPIKRHSSFKLNFGSGFELISDNESFFF